MNDKLKYDELLQLIHEITGLSISLIDNRLQNYGVSDWATLNEYLDLIVKGRDEGEPS